MAALSSHTTAARRGAITTGSPSACVRRLVKASRSSSPVPGIVIRPACRAHTAQIATQLTVTARTPRDAPRGHP
jgi:hypothetical protein